MFTPFLASLICVNLVCCSISNVRPSTVNLACFKILVQIRVLLSEEELLHLICLSFRGLYELHGNCVKHTFKVLRTHEFRAD
ncbi:hypothetical protein M758_UG058100 [Ceratodon purpureus]|nr:hypothetical protein M758_UG058100 [Ceratodon purpureus]